MLRYNGVEVRYECRICHRVCVFQQIENTETQKTFYEDLGNDNTYEVIDDEGSIHTIFICNDCLNFFKELVENCVNNLTPRVKVKE